MVDERWQELRRQLAEAIMGAVGRIEYGNLRMEVYEGEGAGDHARSRIAVAYETPGGSTNQFEISYRNGQFSMLDAQADREVEFNEPTQVIAAVQEHVDSIPAYRQKRLRQDIDQWIADGSSRIQVLEELSRLLRLGPEFRGGSLTVDELTEACRYVVQCCGDQGA